MIKEDLTLDNSCLQCVWFLGVRSCLAFPQESKIPNVIWSGKNKHRKKYRGDGGLRFEKLD